MVQWESFLLHNANNTSNLILDFYTLSFLKGISYVLICYLFNHSAIYWKEHFRGTKLDLSIEYNLGQCTVGLISKKGIISHRLDRRDLKW